MRGKGVRLGEGTKYQPPTGGPDRTGETLSKRLPRDSAAGTAIAGGQGRLGTWAAGQSHAPRKTEQVDKRREKLRGLLKTSGPRGEGGGISVAVGCGFLKTSSLRGEGGRECEEVRSGKCRCGGG